MEGYAIVPPTKGDGFVELTRSATGRVFEKQILAYGDLMYPGVKGGKVKIDDQFADTLIANFTNDVCDIVQVPKAGPNNEHTEAVDSNIGEVIGLSKRNNKVYAKIDARDPVAAEKIAKKLYLGASAMLHLDYTDTRTGGKVGPTLLHVAVTNRPYVTGLEDYQELLAASADTASDAVFLTAMNEEKPMTLDELLAELKADHNIDVPALQASAAEAVKAVALSAKIQEELVGTGLLKLTAGEEVSADTLIGAVAEAGEKIVTLSAKVDDLITTGAKKDATTRVDELVRTGFITPAKKEASLKLLLSNPESFEEMLPEKPIVALTHEAGEDISDELPDNATVESEIARLSASPAAAAYIRS